MATTISAIATIVQIPMMLPDMLGAMVHPAAIIIWVPIMLSLLASIGAPSCSVIWVSVMLSPYG